MISGQHAKEIPTNCSKMVCRHSVKMQNLLAVRMKTIISKLQIELTTTLRLLGYMTSASVNFGLVFVKTHKRMLVTMPHNIAAVITGMKITSM